MLRKFLVPTVIVSILLLLTTLITIAKTEVASVVTSTTATSVTTTVPTRTTAVTIPIPTVATKTTKTTTPRQRKITIVHAQSANPKGTRVIYQGRKIIFSNNNSSRSSSNSSRRNYSRVASSNSSSSSSSNSDISNNNKQLLNNAEETTTSLLPLQPTLSVTSTTLASLIINQEQGQQQQQQSQKQANVKQQQPQKQKQKQQQKNQQHHQHQPEHQKRQNRQPIQDVTDATTTAKTTQQSEKHLINVTQTENDSQPEKLNKYAPEISAKVEVVTPIPTSTKVELVTPVPTSTHAYIPFELDYNDPTEEKARPPEVQRQSTINEVLSSLFPIGFSDIFRFSYDPGTDVDEQPAANIPPATSSTTTTTTVKPPYSPITRMKSTGTRLSTTTVKPTQIPITVIKSTPMPFKPMPTEKAPEKIKELLDLNIPIPFKPMPTSKPKPKAVAEKNNSASDETSDNTQIVVEKILADLGTGKSSEEFRDGSNSISKDELLRINRAAKQASVLPSMLLNPQDSKSSNKTNSSKQEKAIVILNDNANDDFVDAPEDDNQIAESQNIVRGIYHTPPPESVSYHQDENHEMNVHIIHDEKKKETKNGEQSRSLQSYQAFVEQAKFLQNSLQEAPSRKFLKSFNPTLTHVSNPSPVAKGNFHYEQTPENHIQTVPPAAQLQYVLFHRPQEQEEQHLEEFQKHEESNQSIKPPPHYRSNHEGFFVNGGDSGNSQEKNNGNQVHYVIEMPNNEQPDSKYHYPYKVSELHTHISDSNHLSDKDTYHTVDAGNNEPPQSVTPVNLVFVTINTPEALDEIHHSQQQPKHPSKAPLLGLSKPYQSPSEYVPQAINARPEHVSDHQTEETENNPKPSRGDENGGGGGGYTFVEVQKSINIHNKLITEKDGRLVEQHETIYPQAKYGERLEYKPSFQQEPHPHQEPHNYVTLSHQDPHPQLEPNNYVSISQHEPEPQQEPHNYVSLSQHPIHVESSEHEPAESLQAIQHALDPSQSLIDIGAIQQSNLVQESHIIETPITEGEHAEALVQYQEHEQYHPGSQTHHDHAEHHHEHPEPSQNPDQPPIQIPYALPQQVHAHANHQQYSHYKYPLILQEVIEKHVHIPYAVQEPVPYPVAVQHFIDRPVPIETIVEKPVPYPVEKVVERVVEKHVPVEVEKIIEKPVEKIVEKYIDRPVAIPIKIPVALQVTPQTSPYSPYFPSSFGDSGQSNLGPWSQQPTLTRIPTKVLQTYYNKMLKKLVPQMTQAFKTSPLASKPKMVPKYTPKANTKYAPKTGDMRYDLKPPPPPAFGTSWDVGARYQYDYNTLPMDLSASSSTAIGKQSEHTAPGFKTNFDEFQRWRNGHSLKRSPELGMNLHVEYGFKPPLVPSVEIDDKGMPLKAASDLTKGKDE